MDVVNASTNVCVITAVWAVTVVVVLTVWVFSSTFTGSPICTEEL